MANYNPTYSHFSKDLWEDPAWREKMEKRDADLKKRRAEDPWSMTNYGVHAAGSKEAAIPLWREAHRQADKYLEYMKQTGQAPATTQVTVVDRPNVIPHTAPIVPESEEEMAALVLREAFVLALGPSSGGDKIKAMNMVLTYTKPKPESVTRMKVEKAEDFLDLIAEIDASTAKK